MSVPFDWRDESVDESLRRVSYITGSFDDGFTKVTYGVPEGTRYEYFPPDGVSVTFDSDSDFVVLLDPDRPRDVDEE